MCVCARAYMCTYACVYEYAHMHMHMFMMCICVSAHYITLRLFRLLRFQLQTRALCYYTLPLHTDYAHHITTHYHYRLTVCTTLLHTHTGDRAVHHSRQRVPQKPLSGFFLKKTKPDSGFCQFFCFFSCSFFRLLLIGDRAVRPSSSQTMPYHQFACSNVVSV